MSARRSVSHEVKAEGSSLTLADLRWLVKQCEPFGDASAVRVQVHRSVDMRDTDQVTVSVQGVADQAARTGA